MKPFQYATARSVAGAPGLLGNDGCYLAGGNDLLGRMKEYIVEPKTLVNIKALPGLDRIDPGDKIWTIGALATVAQLEEHAGLGKAFPALHQAAAEVGSQQIRNVATVGGNLAQHSRCWYFRHRDVYCLKKGGDTCHARNGENKYHSLFSGSPCISPVVSNLAIALAALDATVLVQRGNKTVRMSIAEFYTKAWDDPTVHHSLASSDLILQVEVPTHRSQSDYLQISEKSMFDWALVSCAAAARLSDNQISQVRIVLGAVAPVPYQVPAAHALLEGKVLDDALADQTAERILQDAQPLAHNAYKVPMARALIRRTLIKLLA